MAKPKKDDYDYPGWQEAVATGKDLVTDQSQQKTAMRELEDMYFMDWQEATPEGVKRTISPEPRNKVQGASRLLTATEPHFDVPKERNNPEAMEQASKLEQAAAVMWNQSNALQSSRVERDLAKSGFLYDWMIVQVVSTADIQKQIEESAERSEHPDAWKGRIRRAKENAMRTPHLFEPLSPRVAYPVMGIGGLDKVHIEKDITLRDVKAKWGEVESDKKDHQTVTYCEQWDDTNLFVWLKGAKNPIHAKPHELTFVPVAGVTAEGSRIFAEAKRQIEPFLYTVKQSGVWQAQNAWLTAIRTNLYGLLNAQWKFRMGTSEDETPQPEHNVIGNIVPLPPGSDLAPLTKDIIDANAMAFWNIIGELAEKSTMFEQALGAPIGGNAAFSMVSLLMQQGRLPLVGVQDMLGMLLAQAMGIAFAWLRDTGGTMVRDRSGKNLEIKRKDIPEIVAFEVTVEVDLPQDKLQMANVARMMSSGQDPIMSKAWAREFLGEGQPEQMQKAIWREKASEMRAQQKAMETLAKLSQATAPPPSGSPQTGESAQFGGSETLEGLPQVMAGPQPDVLPPGMTGPAPQGTPEGEL